MRPGVAGTLVLCALLLPPAALAAQEGPSGSGAGPRADSVLSVETPTGALYVETFGTGPAVIVLHGFAARWLPELWTPLLDALSGEFMVIGTDLRGHGRSAKTHDSDAYGLGLVADVVRVLDRLGVERAHVVGYSMGGIVALRLAASHPERVASLSLLGQGWVQEGELQEMASSAAALLEVDTAALPEAEREGFRRNDVRALVALAVAYPELGVSARELAEMRVPLLAVVGSEDPRLARARALVSELPSAELVVLPGRDHETVAGDDAYAESIAGFVRGVEARAAKDSPEP